MKRLWLVLLFILSISTGILSFARYSNPDLILFLFVSGALLVGVLWLGTRKNMEGAGAYTEPPRPEGSKGVKRRASLRLAGEVGMAPEEAIAVVRKVAKRLQPVSGLGAHFSVLGQALTRLELVCSSGDSKFEFFTLSAEASTNDGKTSVRVGGLETYKTDQLTLEGLIPVGTTIRAMDAYRYFLKECKRELVAADAGACLTIARVK